MEKERLFVKETEVELRLGGLITLTKEQQDKLNKHMLKRALYLGESNHEKA